jgi:O-antigen/teichoic acid export membrane protein
MAFAARLGRSRRGGSGPEGLLRSSSLMLTAQLTTATFTAVLTLYLVRALGPHEYGLFALALSVGALVLLPADFGISASAQRFIAERREDAAGVTAVLARALRLKVVVSGVVCGALFALAGPIADIYGHPGLAWPLRGMALAVLGQSLMAFFSGAFIALARVAVNVRIVLAESATEAGASIALVALGGAAAGAAFGRAIGYGTGTLIALALAVRWLGLRPGRLRDGAGSDTRRLAGYAGALFVVDTAYTLFNQIDVLLIGVYLPASAAGLFQAPVRLTTLFLYPALALSQGLAPRLAGRADSAEGRARFAVAARVLTLGYLAVIAPLIAWATPIVHLVLGAGYGGSAAVLRGLAPFVFLASLGNLLSLSVNYLGAARRRVPLALATFAINLLLDIALIPRIGIIAGAIATDVAYAVYVGGHARICRDLLGLSLRDVGRTIVWGNAAAAAATGVLVAFGTAHLTIADWVLGGLSGLAAFGAVLVLSGEVTLAEVRALGRILRARVQSA